MSSNLSKTTKDHDEIRRWAEERGAIPAEVARTEGEDGEPGILRFMFPDAPHHNDGALKEIGWDEFFEKFDERNLELLFQETTAEGAESNFNKLIHPESEKEHAHGSKSTAKGGTKASSKSASGNGRAKSASSGKSAGSTTKKSTNSKGTTSKSGSKSHSSRKKAA